MASSPTEDVPTHSPQKLRVADWDVDPSTGRICQDGTDVRLEPRVMAVLEYLARRPGQTVSREELERAVWSGSVVGYEALSRAIAQLRKALGDDPRNPRFIETHSKRGYRLIAPVQLGNSGAGEPTTVGSPSGRRRSMAIAASIVLAAVGLFAWWTSNQQSPLPDLPANAIAVLPFANLGGDRDKDYFAAGIAADLITDLSKLAGLRVMARGSSFANLGTSDVGEIARALNVRYVLEGSVLHGAGRLRINAQLVDAQSRQPVWAERFEGRQENIFSLQDAVVRGVVEAMSIHLTHGESQRIGREASASFQAYDLFLRAQRYYFARTREDNAEGKALYRRAIEIDSEFGRAYGALAVAHAQDALAGWSENPEESLERALLLALRGVALDNASPHTEWALAYVRLLRREHSLALESVQHVQELAPSYADGYALLGFIYNWMGDHKQAFELTAKAMDLNPNYSQEYLWGGLGFAHFNAGNFDMAIKLAREALDRNDRALYARLMLACALVRAGRPGEAAWEIEQVRLAEPNYTLSVFARSVPLLDPRSRTQWVADLRTAGLPE